MCYKTVQRLSSLLLQGNLRASSCHPRTPKHGRLDQLGVRSTAVERHCRLLFHRSKTRHRRNVQLSRQAGREWRPAQLDLLDLFDKCEDIGSRSRCVEMLRSNCWRAVARLECKIISTSSKTSIQTEFTEIKQAPEESTKRVTCDMLPV